MMKFSRRDSTGREDSAHGSRGLWFLAAGGLLVIILAILLPRENSGPADRSASSSAQGPTKTSHSPAITRGRAPQLRSNDRPGPRAEEIVASKVRQFASNRRGIAYSMARHFKVEVPTDVERFFDAAEAGRWDDLDSLFKSIVARKQTEPRSHELDVLWGPILETYGVAEVAHNWPAQKLLDYGQSVLSSLRPGMVYVGGTDTGRFIPTLLNETSSGERHIILTQNSLADQTYLDYTRFLYAGRLETLTQEDSQRAFQDYMTDAQKRLRHDEQFPEEPKQVRPGEEIRSSEGRIQVSGQVAVMGINEKLLLALMDKNPDASFALEESFPLKSTYASASPLGPIMELRAGDAENALTAQRAAQSIDYWRMTADQFLSEAATPEMNEARKSYSKLAIGQGNLFTDRNYTDQAEQAYRIASEICPFNPEAVGGLSELLTRQGRAEEARQLLEDFARRYPDQRAALEASRGRVVPSP